MIIDYETTGNPIGEITTLINNDLVHQFDDETNSPELLNAPVYGDAEYYIVLCYNNEYVLFEKIR